MHTAKDEHENEQNMVYESGLLVISELKEIRNNFLAGLGFAIGILISLISIGILEKTHVWFILIGIFAGIGIFVGINVKTFRTGVRYGLVIAKFRSITLELLKIEGKISGIAMTEDIRPEHIMLIANFLYLITQALSYEIGHFSSDKLGSGKPEQDIFRNAYEAMKTQIELIKQTNLKEYAPRLELFVKEFEANEKRTK